MSRCEAEARSTSKSSVSRTFVARTAETLGELMGRRLDDVRLAVLMLDGIELKDRTNIVALGITTEGVKVPLGLWEGSHGEQDGRYRAARRSRRPRPRRRAGRAGRDRRLQGAAGGRERGPRPAHPGSSVCTSQGAQRARSPARTRPARGQAPAAPRMGARAITTRHSGNSRRSPWSSSVLTPAPPRRCSEGMAETLTVTRLGVHGALKRTLQSTNPCESMIECVRRARATSSAGSPGRCACAGQPPGCSRPSASSEGSSATHDLAKLALAVEAEIARPTATPAPKEAATLVTV